MRAKRTAQTSPFDPETVDHPVAEECQRKVEMSPLAYGIFMGYDCRSPPLGSDRPWA